MSVDPKLSYSKLSDDLTTILKFPIAFKLEYGLHLIAMKTMDIWADLRASCFFPTLVVAIWKR